MKKICLIIVQICIVFSIGILASDWYVRPAGGNYGLENGTSYANAWDGLLNVKWGAGGVQPGDTLWVCGLHVYEMTNPANIAEQANIKPTSGTSESARVTIRGDYPGDAGIIWGAYKISYNSWTQQTSPNSSVWAIYTDGACYQDWFFADITAGSWTVLDKVTSVADCQTANNSFYYDSANKDLYVNHNGADPTGHIYCNRWGYHWLLSGKQYITFKNLKIYCHYRFLESNQSCSYITWDGCTLSYGEVDCLPFYDGCVGIKVTNCEISWAGNAIYNISDTNNAPSYCVFSGNTIHDIGVRPSMQNGDAHGIGIQSGHDNIIEDNYFYNCGTTICLYAFTNQELKNTIIRRNFVKNSHQLGGNPGYGITLQCDNASLSDKSGNKIYQNIVVNCSVGIRVQYEDQVEIYNNVISGCGTSFYSGRSYNNYGPNVKARNNISLNPSSYHVYFATSGANSVCDYNYNLYYPDGGSKFYYNSGTYNFSGWKSLTRAGYTFDPNSTFTAPLFQSPANENFQLQSSSPAIDAGVFVGLSQDRQGTPIPQGFAPDIGAYEYIFSGNPLVASLTASPTSGDAPLTVSFTGSATGGTPPYTFGWTFGDGQSSTTQNPSHVYSAAGNYTATLTVRDSQSATNSKSLTMNVTAATSQLTAAAAANPGSGQAPLAVNFTGSASGGTAPYTYRWTFGDGQSLTSQNPTHTYSAAGNYAAILTVTDSQSATATNSVSISVTGTAGQLIATASASPTSGLAPLAVNFGGSATGGTPPYTYSWDFGDGSSSATQNPSHTYSAIGNYTATLTVTDSGSANANATVSITVGSVTAANLALAAETGAPAPGQGGTTDPSPGNHSFSIGNTASVRSIPNTDYRFSKWTGDVTEAATFNITNTLIMDTNKSLSATFCTKCADVNGDLKITPADAQRAFDIYLGKIANPTWCELENADVKCDGTKFAPKVTPADAQTIFHKYLRKGVVSSDCSGNSRVAALATQGSGFSNVSLSISNVTFAAGQDVVIPVIVESPSDIKAFGFDLSYPSDILTYIGLESTELTNDFDQLEANVLAYQETEQERPKTEPTENFIFGFDPSFATKILTLQAINNSRPSQEFDPASTGTGNYRLLRVGGYKTGSTANPTSGVLVTLIFRVIGELKDPGSISVIATYDDIKNASIKNGIHSPGSSEFSKEYEKPVRQSDRKFIGKRYNF